MAKRECSRRPADGLTGPPEGWIWARCGSGTSPLMRRRGSPCGRATDLVRLAYRTCVYPSKDLVIGSVMIADGEPYG
jgi:hypothetical protein